jgi:hypothetical protein
MHAAQLLTGPTRAGTLPAFLVLVWMSGCSSQVHTLENTSHLSRNELIELCADLEMRATQDCQWNMQERQSSLADQQTWEVNCRARRDSARESFENVCLDSRTRSPQPEN